MTKMLSMVVIWLLYEPPVYRQSSVNINLPLNLTLMLDLYNLM